MRQDVASYGPNGFDAAQFNGSSGKCGFNGSIGSTPAFAKGGGEGGNGGGNDRGVATTRDSVTIGRGNSATATTTATTSGREKAAASLGNLNAAHASATARANASPNSMVGQIAAYETAMKSALAIQDPAQRAAAITAARQDLALSANKSLTPAAITRVDSLLGLPASPSNLGTVTTTSSRGSSTTATTVSMQRDRSGTATSGTTAQAKAAASLGNLNAAHASANARANASPNSMVGQIAAYEAAMKSALAIQDPAQRATAITAARQDLALLANKTLTPAAIARVDSLLGLPASPSNLGTSATTARR
ncbi:MAG: hypothetical protein FJX54_17995 [Alphaproteobacteria bacterium]|nr:hypothetical protein [Alphaproteobacteria bacterium]